METQFVKKDMTRKVEKKSVSETSKPREFLARTISHPHFMMLLLVIAIVDTIFAATSLTADVLAMKREYEEVCNTRTVLTFLHDQHRGEMDYWFSTHTDEEILEEVVERGGPHIVYRSRREIRDNNQTTPEAGISTTLPSLDRNTDHLHWDDSLSDEDLMHSSELYALTRVFRYACLALLIVFAIIKGLRIYAMGWKFFGSKLQTADALVILISLPIDIAFSPAFYRHADAYFVAIPILYDVSSRVARVVIKSLINLHEKKKILLKEEKRKLKQSTKISRYGKRQIKNLRELGRKLGADEGSITACSKNVKKTKKRTKKNSLLFGLRTAHQILFMACPNTPLVPDLNFDVITNMSVKFKDATDMENNVTHTDTSTENRNISSLSTADIGGSATPTYDDSDDYDDDDDYGDDDYDDAAAAGHNNEEESAEDDDLEDSVNETEDDNDLEGQGQIIVTDFVTYM